MPFDLSSFEDPRSIIKELLKLPPHTTRISRDGTRLYFFHDNEFSCVFTSREKPWTDKPKEELEKFIQMYVNPKPRKK